MHRQVSASLSCSCCCCCQSAAAPGLKSDLLLQLLAGTMKCAHYKQWEDCSSNISWSSVGGAGDLSCQTVAHAKTFPQHDLGQQVALSLSCRAHEQLFVACRKVGSVFCFIHGSAADRHQLQTPPF